METAVNWVAVAVSMVAAVGIGFLWYGPLFGKMWMKESGIHMPDKTPNMTKPIVISLVGALFLAYVMSVKGAGLENAFWYWLGFVAPVMLSFVAWEGKSWKLFAIQGGYWLVTLLVSGVVIARMM